MSSISNDSLTLVNTRSVSFSLDMIYRDAVPKGGTRRRHRDAGHSYWLLEAGSVRIERDQHPYTCGPGSWALLDPDQIRDQVFSPDAQLLSVRFRFSQAEPRRFHISSPPTAIHSCEVPSLKRQALSLLRAWNIFEHNGTMPHWNRIQQRAHAFWSLWWKLLEQHNCIKVGAPLHDHRLQRALSVLDEHQGLGIVPYEALCETAGLGRCQFDRLFRHALGCTPRAYLERRCLERAYDLLTEDRWDIGTIARHLDFVDGSHFAKWFRGRTGMPPARWRERQGA